MTGNVDRLSDGWTGFILQVNVDGLTDGWIDRWKDGFCTGT